MKIKLDTLVLQCKKSREVITLSPHVSFFHGPIGSGKSSIARLIDFCLGGELEMTTALTQEFVSATLTARLGDTEVLFERDAHTHQVQATWKAEDETPMSVMAPLHPAEEAILNDNVFTLSDLIFHLCDIVPIRVRRSKHDELSPMIPLSFRDIMWYCYLEQAHLDSTFFRLKEPFTSLKSRDVMRFVVGYYTEKLQQLEVDLERAQSERVTKIATAAQIKTFLVQFDFGTAADIEAELNLVKFERERAVADQQAIRQATTPPNHPIDELKSTLRALVSKVNQEEETLTDLRTKVAEQESLRAEIVSSKFKLARTQAATTVLEGVKFEMCPACGLPVLPSSNFELCHLCGRPQGATKQDAKESADIIGKDLSARVEELTDSLERSRKALKKQEKTVDEIRARKQELDKRLSADLKDYDSAFLAKSREADRKVTVSDERLRHLARVQKMPDAVKLLELEADALLADEERIKRAIIEERKSLTDAEVIVGDIERSYLAALLAVGLPGVTQDDVVVLNRRTWIPAILSQGEQGLQWDFYNTGSGGKKTLVNVCYALAVHKVAAERSLPLPTFLIIDTPMKNIGEDVNRDVFVAFYEYLYSLARGVLSETQIIIIDKEYIPPEPADVDVTERLMKPKDDKHPPLITYYRGP